MDTLAVQREGSASAERPTPAPGPGLFGPLNPPLPRWEDARVWVIGASSGMGEALVRQLLDAGARVAMSARTAIRLHEIAGTSPRAMAIEADIADSTTLVPAWQRIHRRWGGCDLVLIVAGPYRPIRAWELTERNAIDLLDVNLHGVIRTCAAVIPTFVAKGSGALAIVSGLAGYRGLSKALVYGASKAALIHFAETLWLDLRPRGIGVYLVNPGFPNSPLRAPADRRMAAPVEADVAAAEILRGLRAGRFEIHFPKRSSRTMKLLRILPYRLYFALARRIGPRL